VKPELKPVTDGQAGQTKPQPPATQPPATPPAAKPKS